jgi:cytochrome c553
LKRLKAIDSFHHVSRQAARDRDHERGHAQRHLRGGARACKLYFQAAATKGIIDVPNTTRIERAKSLVSAYRCDFCHRPDFAGDLNVPRLAGQREDYLIKALRGYKDNSRSGYDASMADVMAPITDEQILDVAYYLARVR